MHPAGSAIRIRARGPTLPPFWLAFACGMALTFSVGAIAAAFAGHWVVRLNQGGRYNMQDWQVEDKGSNAGKQYSEKFHGQAVRRMIGTFIGHQ
jgi:hypothetical protein